MPLKPISSLPFCLYSTSGRVQSWRLLFPGPDTILPIHLSRRVRGISPLDVRLLHATPCAAKKKNRAEPQSPVVNKAPPKTNSASSDPLDLTQLQTSIDNAHAKLKEDLSKLRPAGRFNPELVEILRVRLSKGSNETIQLKELALCVPRGRVLNITAGEKDHVKPIASAIQSSNLSLTPQQDPQNPLQLNVQLPPPTAESRKQVVQDAMKLADSATTAIKNARAAHQKLLRAPPKSIRSDEIKIASNKMEKIATDATKAVKETLGSVKKHLESG